MKAVHPFRIKALREQLLDPRPGPRLAAVRAAEKLGEREVAADLLSCFQSESDWEIRKECIIALGHLKHRESMPVLKKAAADKKEDLRVRKWAIWAVGELGTTAEDSFLLRLQDSKLHPLLGQVTGGALKKVRLESVRVPRAAIERQMRPPKTTDPRLKRLREQLDDIGPPQPGLVPPEILALRRHMKEVDEEYFSAYMDWLRRLPELAKALTNPRVSY